MGREGRATIWEIWQYLTREPFVAGSRKVKRLDIPGYDKLVIKMNPTHKTVNQQNSREPGEKLFDILSCFPGIYDVVRGKIFEEVFQNYGLDELEEMRNTLETLHSHFSIMVKTRIFHRSIDKVIEMKKKQEQSYPAR